MKHLYVILTAVCLLLSCNKRRPEPKAPEAQQKTGAPTPYPSPDDLARYEKQERDRVESCHLRRQFAATPQNPDRTDIVCPDMPASAPAPTAPTPGNAATLVAARPQKYLTAIVRDPPEYAASNNRHAFLAEIEFKADGRDVSISDITLRYVSDFEHAYSNDFGLLPELKPDPEHTLPMCGDPPALTVTLGDGIIGKRSMNTGPVKPNETGHFNFTFPTDANLIVKDGTSILLYVIGEMGEGVDVFSEPCQHRHVYISFSSAGELAALSQITYTRNKTALAVHP